MIPFQIKPAHYQARTDKDLKRNDAKNVIVMIDINFNIK